MNFGEATVKTEALNALSFQEKSAWGMLVGHGVIGALYFSSAWHLWRADQLSAIIMIKLAFGYMLVLIVAAIIYHTVVAAIDRPPGDDERDRLIAWRAGAVGGTVLAFGVFAIIGHLVLNALYGGVAMISPIFIANTLLLALLAATLAELAAKLWFYRRGV